MITTRINLKPHLAEYCVGKWGTEFHEPVRFPRNTDIYLAVFSLTQKRPKDCPLDSGNLEIVLPVRGEKDEILNVYKNPEVYNYITEKGNHIIQDKIEDMFRADLHTLIDHARHRKGFFIVDTVYTFMNLYRIESISEDGLIKDYQRWQRKVRKREKRGYKTNINMG